MRFFNKLRVDRVLKLFQKYNDDAILNCNKNKDESSNPEEHYAYYHGISMGYKYAMAQVERKDINTEKKGELLFEYKSNVEESDIRAVCIFLNLHKKKKSDELLPVRGSFYKDKSEEQFREGFMKALENSYRLFQDGMLYMTFPELFFAKR